MSSNSPNSNTGASTKATSSSNKSTVNSEYEASIDPKSVLIALAVMIPLFVAAVMGFANASNNSKTNAIDFFTPVGHSFEEWAAENPNDVDSIYDKEITFSEFAAMVGNDASAKNITAKVTQFGNNDSRICFSKTDVLIGDKFLYSTLTDKTEEIDKC